MIRFFDLLFSFLLIIVSFPIFVIIALFILYDSKGPVFYKQYRIGKNGNEFALIKFRSMVIKADKNGLLTIGQNDSRITRPGQFIRKYKLDELPQLLNVIKGQMSMVGPRPEVKKYVDLYTEQQMKVILVKPGITDYASIYYKDENKLLALAKDAEWTYINEIMPHKIQLNLKFIQNPSIVHYFKILWLTFTHVFFQK